MGKKIVLTYYYTGGKDLWHKDIDVYHCNNRDFDTLYNSVKDRGYDFVTLANELKPDKEDWTVEYISKPDDVSVYVHKYIACYEYLKKHPEYDEIWIVDSADTEMLATPEPNDYSVYSGYDAYSPIFHKFYPVKYLVGGWADGVWFPGIFEKGHKYDEFAHRVLRELYADNVAWNCGIFGGKREPVMKFLEKFIPLLENTDSDTEMGIFNYVIYALTLKYGDEVKCCTTRMTLGEKDYTCWWRHK